MITDTYEAPPVEEAEAPLFPHSREAEEATLGAVLYSPEEVWPQIRFLKAEDFYIHKHRFIFDAFMKLGERIDYLTVIEELKKSNRLAEIGGPAYLTTLLSQVPNSLNARSYAEIVKEHASRRQMITDAEQMVKDAHDLKKPIVTAPILDPSQYSTWADINTGPIEHSWEGWLVNGLLTLLVSNSGDGKSLLAERICGSFINGDPWPDGTPYTGEKGKVLWVECEAAQALNLLRANVFKYPLDRFITALEDPLEDASLDNPGHRAIIEQRAALPEVKFIVIDSLSGSSNKKENDTQIKEITKWAATLARALNKPILLIHHLNKPKEWDSATITLDRVRGSSAIVQFARVVWALSCPDATNKQTKRLEQIKNNLGRFPEAIGMTATEKGIEFGTAPTVPHVESASDRVHDLLLDLLASAPVKATELEAEIKRAGESMRTAKRVKEQLGIVSVKKDDGWYWSLPARNNGHA